MNDAFLVKETLQITPFTHKHSHATLFTPSGAGREKQGGQADETLGFFPVIRSFAFPRSVCRALIKGTNAAEQPIPFTVPQGQEQAA